MKIKICGLTRENDIEACINAGIDYLGFNLLKVSKRFVDIQWTSKIINKYKISSKSAILIDDQVSLSDIENNFDDDIILQFYGKNYENFQNYSIFKPISVTELKHLSDHNINNTKNIKYLIDNMDSALGGTGKKFDWSNLDNIDLSNLMIAGGLSIEDIPILKERGAWGVDLNSKLEIAPGIKDTKLIEELRHYYE